MTSECKRTVLRTYWWLAPPVVVASCGEHIAYVNAEHFVLMLDGSAGKAAMLYTEVANLQAWTWFLTAGLLVLSAVLLAWRYWDYGDDRSGGNVPAGIIIAGLVGFIPGALAATAFNNALWAILGYFVCVGCAVVVSLASALLRVKEPQRTLFWGAGILAFCAALVALRALARVDAFSALSQLDALHGENAEVVAYSAWKRLELTKTFALSGFIVWFSGLISSSWPDRAKERWRFFRLVVISAAIWLVPVTLHLRVGQQQETLLADLWGEIPPEVDQLLENSDLPRDTPSWPGESALGPNRLDGYLAVYLADHWFVRAGEANMEEALSFAAGTQIRSDELRLLDFPLSSKGRVFVVVARDIPADVLVEHHWSDEPTDLAVLRTLYPRYFPFSREDYLSNNVQVLEIEWRPSVYSLVDDTAAIFADSARTTIYPVGAEHPTVDRSALRQLDRAIVVPSADFTVQSLTYLCQEVGRCIMSPTAREDIRLPVEQPQ